MGLRSGSDGVAVAESWRDAESWPSPPLLVLDSLLDYLDSCGLGTGSLGWQQLTGGHSNATFRLAREGAELVLRRGPRPPLPPSAHNMVREARLQAALRSRGVATPEIVRICSDDRVIGSPFYLMPFLRGVVMIDSTVVEPLETWYRAPFAAVDVLADLHAVPVDEALARFGRADGYLERQIERFSGLWEINSRRTFPRIAELGVWLREHRPPTQRATVVHGDFRLGNLMFHRGAQTTVEAVLDWEMSTIGDPLADLGYFTATYSDSATDRTVIELTTVTRLEGFPDRNELVLRYADRAGIDVSPLAWYQTLALWKAAIFLEAIYTRWLDGERPGDEFGPTLRAGVPAILESAWATAETYSPTN